MKNKEATLLTPSKTSSCRSDRGMASPWCDSCYVDPGVPAARRVWRKWGTSASVCSLSNLRRKDLTPEESHGHHPCSRSKETLSLGMGRMLSI